MTPAELHAEVLAALAAAGDAVADATAAPWYVGATVGPSSKASITTRRLGVAYDVPFRDAHLVVALRNTASAAYRGARRIIERHAPMTYGPSFPPCCDRCESPGDWPCPDYRDAAAVIPHLPKEVADALRR